ncbi:MAG: hypothetical protein AAB373_02485 [Patescibacteria group bacterium]
MSNQDFITIQDASELSNKSIQTIRRAIKAKKIKVKKIKTPQGFNYLIDPKSLEEAYGVSGVSSKESAIKEEVKSQIDQVSSDQVAHPIGESINVEVADFKNLVRTLDTLLMQHNDERQNFLRLMNTMQEKIFVLENQLNLLSAPAKRWYQLWK